MLRIRFLEFKGWRFESMGEVWTDKVLRHMFALEKVRLLGIADKLSSNGSVVRVIFLKSQVRSVMQGCFIQLGCFVSVFGVDEPGEVFSKFRLVGSELAGRGLFTLFRNEGELTSLHLKSA